MNFVTPNFVTDSLASTDGEDGGRRARRSPIGIIPLAIWCLLTMALDCNVPCNAEGVLLVFLSSLSSCTELTRSWAHRGSA